MMLACFPPFDTIVILTGLGSGYVLHGMRDAPRPGVKPPPSRAVLKAVLWFLMCTALAAAFLLGGLWIGIWGV